VFLENLQTIDKSALLIPFQARDCIGVDTELLDDSEIVKAGYDFIEVYLPDLYVHNHAPCMYLEVIICFNEPFEDCLQKTLVTLRGDGQAICKRSLQVEEIDIMGYLLYSHHDVPIELMGDKLSRMSGYHMSA
jgi:hypothetical protein